MRAVLRRILFSTGTIYALFLINPGFTYFNGYKTVLLAGFVMFFMDTILEPFLKIIFLPINFLTRGVFGWLIAVGLFYALTYFVPALHIAAWTFPGYILPIFNYITIRIPEYSFNFWSNLVLLAFSYNLLAGTLKWLCED